jgi:serine/threonine protein kinase
MQLKKEQVLNSRYCVGDQVGKGGMARVYCAKDRHIDRDVAIKVLEIGDEDSKKDFQHEMQAVGKLDHPHILPLYDYGEDEVDGLEISYMVMPFIEKGSLKTWFKHRTDPLPLNTVNHIIQQAASALQYAHDKHLIHRDVKPDNFLVRINDSQPDFPDVLLADFGIAKFTADAQTTIGKFRGTLRYAAPERWSTGPTRDRYQPGIDQYALAITAYELLTGSFPFQGDDLQLIYQHTNQLPEMPSRMNASIPNAVDQVILRALGKKPEERFASIASFAEAFQQAVRSTEVAPPLHMVLAISQTDASLGITCPLSIPGPGNRTVTVTVPPGSHDGQILPPSHLEGPYGPLIVMLAVKPATEQDQMITYLQHVATPPPPSTPMTSRTKLLLGAQVLVVVLLLGAILASIGISNQIASSQKQMSTQITDTQKQMSTFLTETANSAASSSCGATSDTFQGNLHARWKWQPSPNNNANYTLGQNSLSMTINSNGRDDLSLNNTQAPRLLQPVNGNFTVKATVNFSPSKWYQGAGILIWEDENHFLRLERAPTTSGLLFGAQDGSTFNERAQTLPLPQAATFDQIELMLQRVDTHFTAYWRTATNQTWSLVGIFDLAFTDLNVGLDLVNTSTTAATAMYNNFVVSCD